MQIKVNPCVIRVYFFIPNVSGWHRTCIYIYMEERYYNLQSKLQQILDVTEREAIADELRNLGDYIYETEVDDLGYAEMI